MCRMKPMIQRQRQDQTLGAIKFVRAAVITRPGGPEVLDIEERAVPTPGPGEILVRVISSALNRADLSQRRGRYPAPLGAPQDIPGLEFAGVVSACGPYAQRFREGDRVCGLVPGGAHAEFLVAHERAVAAVPLSLDWRLAGASVEVFVTAHDALVSQADVRPGETVLVHAAGSGVGLAAIQLASELGCTVYGTARGDEKLAAARDAGMRDGATPGEPGWVAAAVQDWTGGRGVDVVLDLVGGDYTAESIAALAPRGRLMLIGTMGGTQSTVDLRTILTRRLTVRGTVLRSRPLEERIMVMRAFEQEVLPWLASGRLSTRIDAVFSLNDIAAAHALLESNKTIGKVALEISTTSSLPSSPLRAT